MRQAADRRPVVLPSHFLIAAALAGAVAAALSGLAASPHVVPMIAPWFDAMASLPSHVTDTGYPKQREFALACWIIPCSLAGAVFAALAGRTLGRRFAGSPSGRARLARLEAVLLLLIWSGAAALAIRAVRP